MDIVVKREHPLTKDRFPLGFKTTLTKSYSKEDKVTEGFTTNIAKVGRVNGALQRVWEEKYIEEVVTPKGTFLDVHILGIDNKDYSGDWFYRMTGRSFSEFFDK